MKLAKVVSLSTLSLFLGASAFMYAQEQHEDSKPNDESRPAATKPAHDDKAKPAQDEKGNMAKPQDEKPNNSARPAEQSEDKNMRGDERTGKQENNSKPAETRNGGQTMQAQGGQGGEHHGGRIPDDKFRSNFGRQHTFVVSRPTVVSGQPQFQYSGYSFQIIGAWPTDWAYTDQCYVDYVNGEYLLFDLAHPGVSVALVVVM
jgi:hypothetical protein